MPPGPAPRRERKDVVVEAEHCDLVAGAKVFQEPLRGRLHERKRCAHAGADVQRRDELERDVLRLEARDLLQSIVVVDLEVGRLQASHESPIAVGHDRGELKDVDVNRLGERQAFGVNAGSDSASLDQLHRDADRMFLDADPRVPIALERQACQRGKSCARQRRTPLP